MKREKDENLSIRWIVRGDSIVSLDPMARKPGDNGFQFGTFLIISSRNPDRLPYPEFIATWYNLLISFVM